MELERVHLLRILQMPGGTSEILMRGEKNGTHTKLYYTEGLICVKRNVQGISHTRLVPLNNVQSMEEYGGKPEKKGAQGAGKRSPVDQGKAIAGGRSNKAKAS
tara:strand:+ start:210 stop:518 length:309 start_codon:yes stop_codon:yes gene_type:complete